MCENTIEYKAHQRALPEEEHRDEINKDEVCDEENHIYRESISHILYETVMYQVKSFYESRVCFVYYMDLLVKTRFIIYK